MAQKISLFLLRLSLGWLFLYAGITKVLNPDWSAAGYLKGAKTFSFFYNWLLGADILPVVNFINQWGLTLLGVSLILGCCVRFSAPLGALLMMLYYFPVLQFSYIDTRSFLVNEHIIYALSLIFLAVSKAGHFWGLDMFWEKIIKTISR